MFKKMFFAITVTLLTFTSCKKEVIDNMTLISTGKWKIVSQTENGATVPFSGCDNDDTWSFANSGVLTLDQGVVKCDPSDPQTLTLVWAFVGSDQKKIILSDGSNSSSASIDIIELTSTTLKLSSSNTSNVTITTLTKI
jgi:hypothetical protein